MRTRLGAAGLAVLAGLLLGLAGGAAFLGEEQREWHRLVATGGYALALAALLALGYSLVPTAPVWLRLIVSAGFPILGFAVWTTVTDALESRLDDWQGPATAHLAAGVLLVLVGGILARGREAQRYRPTHR